MVENPNNQNLMPKFEDQLQNKTINEVTSGRLLDTAYQNKTGKEILLIVTVTCFTPMASDECNGEMDISKDNFMTLIDVAEWEFNGVDNGSTNQTLICIVPVGYYYKVAKNDSNNGLSSLARWVEVY